MDEEELQCRKEIVAEVQRALAEADWTTDDETLRRWNGLLEQFALGHLDEHEVCREAMRPYLH